MEILAKFSRRFLVLACGLLLLLPVMSGAARAQGSLEYFLTLKSGKQDAAKTNDTAITSLESSFGELQGNRVADVLGLELDVMIFPTSGYGVGLGLEYHEYKKYLRFEDSSGALPGEVLKLEGTALLYTFKLYAQMGFLLNYIGIGSGNYFLQYHELNSTRKFRGSSEEVLSARVGTRMEFGKWSVLLEYGETRAPEKLFFLNSQPVLELGGRFWNFGVGYAF